MKKLDENNHFYAQQLMDVGVYNQDGSGLLSYKSGDTFAPVLLKKNRLCLPTHEILKESDWDKRTAFNPLSEQVNCGPSDVLNALKDYIRATLTRRISSAALLLMNSVVHSEARPVSPKSMDLHTLLADADTKTYDTLVSVLKEIGNKPEKRLVSILLKSNHGGEYLRSSVVTFPILKDAESGDPLTFFGVKMPRKTKDKRLIVDLLKYVIGAELSKDEYTFGSNDRTAPFYHALLMSFEKFATHLNTIVDRHSDDVEGLSSLRFSLGWTDTMLVFPTFAAANGAIVPPTPGNRGELIKADEDADLSVYQDLSEPARRDDRDDRTDRRDDRGRDVDDRDRNRERESSFNEYMAGTRRNNRDRDDGRGRGRDRDRYYDDDRRGRDSRGRDRERTPIRRDSVDTDYDTYMSGNRRRR